MSPLPPLQQLVAPGKWPLVGERMPLVPQGPWTVSMTGLIDRPACWTMEALQQFPVERRRVDLHCVTRWSRLGVEFGGVSLRTLLQWAGRQPFARYVSFVAASPRQHSTSLSCEVVDTCDPLIVWEVDGQPLPVEHGGPVRVITPGRYLYKSLKWLTRIELLSDDRLGYWESEAGYHNEADPWKEQRYLASQLSVRDVRELLASRDFSGRDLRGMEASHLDLSGLRAEGATLRDARFEGTNLCQADFRGANLSNAQLQRAQLRGAQFLPDATGRCADLEGADFRGADLRGAEFRGASLFGATFGPLDDGDVSPWAITDATTVFDDVSWGTLEATPRQREGLCLASRPISR